jgi:hypothetical protein
MATSASMENAVNSFFIVFAHRLDAPGPPTIYRGDDGKVVVYDTSPKAQAAAADLTVTNKHPNTSFTATEIQLSD